jgi:hypothetical protein
MARRTQHRKIGKRFVPSPLIGTMVYLKTPASMVAHLARELRALERLVA